MRERAPTRMESMTDPPEGQSRSLGLLFLVAQQADWPFNSVKHSEVLKL